MTRGDSEQIAIRTTTESPPSFCLLFCSTHASPGAGRILRASFDLLDGETLKLPPLSVSGGLFCCYWFLDRPTKAPPSSDRGRWSIRIVVLPQEKVKEFHSFYFYIPCFIKDLISVLFSSSSPYSISEDS